MNNREQRVPPRSQPALPSDRGTLVERLKLVSDLVTGEVLNDKEQVLEALEVQESPTGRAKSAKARATSRTTMRRPACSNIGSSDSAVSWNGRHAKRDCGRCGDEFWSRCRGNPGERGSR